MTWRVADGVASGTHNFELFLETGLVYFLLFELFLESNDIIEGGEAIALYVLLGGGPEVEVAVLPEVAFSLCLLEVVAGGVKVVEEESGLGHEHLYDLPELLGVVLAEVAEKVFIVLHNI